MEQVALTLGITISGDVYKQHLSKLINQVYKLLPTREEDKDWQKPLETILEEFAGMKQLVIGQDQLFFTILCKLRGLTYLNRPEDMVTYRRVILELLSLLNMLKNNVNFR